MDSWKKLLKHGYEIIEWNESNCDMTENEYVKKMYKEGKWAFVSDYFRLKVLYEYGGIYLDTDVFVYKSFDSFLNLDSFWGFEYDFAIGTAVIGAKKNSSIIGELLKQYDNISTEIVNNGLVTDFFKTTDFQPNGKTQKVVFQPNSNKAVEEIYIYNKNVFNRGKIVGRSYSIHLCEYSWGKDYVNNLKPWKKFILLRIPFFNYVSYTLHKQASVAKKEKYLKQ